MVSLSIGGKMRITISTKLIAGFLVVILLIVALSFFSVSENKKSLQESAGKNTIFLAEEILKTVNRNIYNNLEKVQVHSNSLPLREAVLKSNKEFEKLDDIQGWINQRDREWCSVPENEITPFMQELISNNLSDTLKEEFIEFYENKYGHRIFLEVFVTNKYGANIAQTQKTSDYRQDDEEWWQTVRENGLYVSNIEYDESAGAYVITVGASIHDESGKFIGIIKGVVSSRELLRKAEITTTGKRETTEIELISEDGKLIYATETFQFLEDISEKYFFNKIKGDTGFFIAEEGKREKLFSYAHSKGYRDLKELPWILVVKHDVEEVLAPAFALRDNIIFASIILIVGGILTAFFISRTIATPLKKLTNETEIIGKGNLEHKIDIDRNDEIGDLSTAFNKMIESLKAVTASRDELEREVTERKKAEKALRMKDLAIHSALSGIAISDMKGLLNDVNPSFLELWGYQDEEEILGKHATEFWANQEKAEKVMKTLEESGSWSGELIAQKKDGSTFHAESTASVVKDSEGNPIAMMSSFRDITERKKVQEELKKVIRELARSNKELEQFAYIASHDLQEPLRMVASYTQLLEKRYKDTLDEDAKEFIRYASAGATRMQKMINGLLTYSRVQTRGKEPELVEAEKALEEAMSNLTFLINENNAKVTYESLPGVYADKDQLVRLFQNLLDNAIEYRSEETPKIQINAERQEDEWEFSVKDNGIGINPKYTDKIFQIYKRLHTRDKHDKTGIGLAICKRIVERHGGRIWVESEEGKGSTFYFTIPTRGGENT